MEYLQYYLSKGARFSDGEVLNLIINGIPSIQYIELFLYSFYYVLNLIINGIPSILN